MGAIISALCCVPGKRRRKEGLGINDSSDNIQDYCTNGVSHGGSFISNPSLIIERRRRSNSSILNNFFDLIESVPSGPNTTTMKYKHRDTARIFLLTRLDKKNADAYERKRFCDGIRLMATQLPHQEFFVNLNAAWQDDRFLYRLDDYAFDRLTVRNIEDLKIAAVDLAIALHLIHSNGLVHGNVSPFCVYINNNSKNTDNIIFNNNNNNNLTSAAPSLRLGGFGHLKSLQSGKRLSGSSGDFADFRAERLDEYFEEIDWIAYAKTLQYWLVNDCVLDNSNNDHGLACLIDELLDPDFGFGPGTYKQIQMAAFFTDISWDARYPTVSKRASKEADLRDSIDSLRQVCSSEYNITTRNVNDDFFNFTWRHHQQDGIMLESLIKEA